MAFSDNTIICDQAACGDARGSRRPNETILIGLGISVIAAALAGGVLATVELAREVTSAAIALQQYQGARAHQRDDSGDPAPPRDLRRVSLPRTPFRPQP